MIAARVLDETEIRHDIIEVQLERLICRQHRLTITGRVRYATIANILYNAAGHCNRTSHDRIEVCSKNSSSDSP